MTTTQPLYPVTYGGWPPCSRCFQQRTDMAQTTDQRISPDGELVTTCGGCFRALAHGRPVELPTGAQLARTWRTLARLHHNEEIDNTLRDRALSALAPSLPTEMAANLFDDLQGALLRAQEVADPGYDLGQEAPEDRCPDRLVERAQAWAAECLAALLPPEVRDELRPPCPPPTDAGIALLSATWHDYRQLIALLFEEEQ